MKNAVAVVALLISVGGIFVSLAREEMRCYLGLANECSIQERTISPKPNQEAIQETRKETTVSSPTPVEPAKDDTLGEKETSHRQSAPRSGSLRDRKPEEPTSEVKAISEKESSEKPVEKETAQKSLDAPFKSQPIEVIPPPEAQNNGSQPIEVIPPPEEQPQ